MIKVIPFQKIHQNAIDEMKKDIATEFEVPISNKSSAKVIEVDSYWIALNESEVIGTIAILRYKNDFSTLKNMFVKQNYRGEKFGTSNLLLKKVMDWCIDEKINGIYLGTMDQFKAAHRFYEKNGFKRISKVELPSQFVNNPLDTIFYKLTLIA